VRLKEPGPIRVSAGNAQGSDMDEGLANSGLFFCLVFKAYAARYL